MPFDPPDRPPRTPNEWGILAVLSAFFALFLLVELAREFEVAKLSAPFFLLSWVVLLVLHEFGHALAARLLGWRVERISIGTGRVRMERVVLGMPVEFRTMPLSGFVLPRPRDLRTPRLKECLVYAAGPGAELLAVALLALLAGTDTLLARSAEVGVIAMQSFCAAAILGALFNLLPLPHRIDGATAWSDGLGMMLCWRRSDEDYRRLRDGGTSDGPGQTAQSSAPPRSP
jgi:hypothetical protein